MVTITHIGGPTALVEFAGWRILTDPTFDPAGGKYKFGWGTGSTKTTGPAIDPADLGPIDAVLLTHDHHEDNLDAAGRAFLPQAGHGRHHRVGRRAARRRDARAERLGDDRADQARLAHDQGHRHARAATARRSATRSSAT